MRIPSAGSLPWFPAVSKTLIIAEKPSVAADLARVLGKQLGKFKKEEATQSYSNDTLIITSAVGHLVEQKKPQTEDGKLAEKAQVEFKIAYLEKVKELLSANKDATAFTEALKAAYPELKSGDYWGKYPGEDYLWYCEDELDFGPALIFFFENDKVSKIILNNTFN